MGRKFILALLFLILLFSLVFAQQQPQQQVLTDRDKAYLDGLNQKTVSQLSQKMDTQTNMIERNLEKSVKEVKEQLKAEIVAEMKGALKSIAFGLGGIIIVVLAVFRIVEHKMQHTKRIRKYEDELKKQKESYDKELAEAKKVNEETKILKRELMTYKESLDKYAVSLGIQPQTELKQGKTELNPPKKKHFFRKIFTVRGMLVTFGVIIFIGLFIFFGLKFLSGLNF